MNKKILIIGGSGIISSAVVDCCIEHGYDVTMINRGNNRAYTNSKAKVILCDARDADRLRSLMTNVYYDVVIDFIVYTKEQLAISLSIFASIAKQYIFISSAQVYNTSVSKEWKEEDETPQPLWSYSVNKESSEKFLRAYCEEHNVNFTIVRPGVNYDNRRIPYGMCPANGKHYTIVARILAGKPIVAWNDGQNKLNITRVEDFANGLIGLFNNPKAYNECINIVGDYVYTWQEVLETIGRILNVSVKTINIPLADYVVELDKWEQEVLLGGRACDLVCSNSKLRSIVADYQTKIDLEEGLRNTIEWYKSNNFYKGFDYRWDAEQDRIINKSKQMCQTLRFIPYVSSGRLHTLFDYSEYQCSYYKKNRFQCIIWRAVRRMLKIFVS